MAATALFAIGSMTVTLGDAMLVVGTATSLIGSIAQGSAMATQAEAQAKQDRINAQLAAEQAGHDAALVYQETQQKSDALREDQQRQRALRMKQWGKSGGGMGESALAVFEGSDYWDQMDREQLLLNGEQQADSILYSGSVASQRYAASAAQQSSQASGYRTSGYLSGVSSAMQLGSKIMS